MILLTLLLFSAFNARISTAAAQGTRFFRLSGPAATSIIAFNPDGTLVWSNALPGTNYEVQTFSSFNGESNWVDFRHGLSGVNNQRWLIRAGGRRGQRHERDCGNAFLYFNDSNSVKRVADKGTRAAQAD